MAARRGRNPPTVPEPRSSRAASWRTSSPTLLQVHATVRAPDPCSKAAMSSNDAIRWNRRALVGLLLVTTLTFARLWFVELSWDDEALVKDNQVTASLANIPEFFTRDLWSTTRLGFG